MNAPLTLNTTPTIDCSAEEWQARVDLACLYRAVWHSGWHKSIIYNHISMRVPGPEVHFLLNPFGLMYPEITASNLLKVDITDGHLIEPSEYEPINAGVVIHGAIYLALRRRVRDPYPHRGGYRGWRARRRFASAVAMGNAVLWPARLS